MTYLEMDHRSYKVGQWAGDRLAVGQTGSIAWSWQELTYFRVLVMYLDVLLKCCLSAPCCVFVRWTPSGTASRHGPVHLLHLREPCGCPGELWGEWGDPAVPPFPSLPISVWKWRYVWSSGPSLGAEEGRMKLENWNTFFKNLVELGRLCHVRAGKGKAWISQAPVVCGQVIHFDIREIRNISHV